MATKKKRNLVPLGCKFCENPSPNNCVACNEPIFHFNRELMLRRLALWLIWHNAKRTKPKVTYSAKEAMKFIEKGDV